MTLAHLTVRPEPVEGRIPLRVFVSCFDKLSTNGEFGLVNCPLRHSFRERHLPAGGEDLG
jgi:hypothetical protein